MPILNGGGFQPAATLFDALFIHSRKFQAPVQNFFVC